MDQPVDRCDAERTHAAVAIFASLVAVGIAKVGFACRLGFTDNSPLDWAKFVGLSWFLVHFSFVARTAMRVQRNAAHDRWWSSHAALTLAGLALTAVCGVESTAVAHGACAAFVLVGAGAFAWRLSWLLRPGLSRGTWRARHFVALVAFAGLFSLYAAGASWGTGYQNPLFVEAMCFGTAQIDTLFHATVSNMLRTYGAPSTGLDGLPLVHYHYGSHWLFARFCNLLDLPVIDFYNRAYPVVVAPFGLFSLLTFAVSMSQRGGNSSEPSAADENPPATLHRPLGGMFWLMLAAGYLGFLPYASGVQSAVSRNSVIVSESYAVAVAVSLLGVVVGASFFRSLSVGAKTTASELIGGIVVLASLTAAIGLLKISVMLVFMAAGGYFLVRLGMYRSRVACAVFVSAAILVYCVFLLTSNPAYSELSGFMPFGFLRVNVEPPWWVHYWLFYYAWTWIVVVVRVRQEGVRTLRELRDAFRERRLLDVEFVLVVALAGAGPGMILTEFSSAHFFSEYQQWLALGFVLAAWIRRRHQLCAAETPDARPATRRRNPAARIGLHWLDRITVGEIAAAVIAMFVGAASIANTAVLLNGVIATNLASRGPAPGLLDPRTAVLQGRFTEARGLLAVTASNVEERFHSDKAILALLRSLNELPVAEKRQSLLFIPKSNRQYWDLLNGPYSPKDGPFVATALAGVAMIDGLYVRPEDDPWTGYGYQHYPCPVVAREQPPIDKYLPVLEYVVAAKGFTQLIVIETRPDGTPDARKYECH